MTINIENLKTLSPEQLRETAGKLGLTVHWKAKPDTIIKQIADKAFAPTKPVEKQEAKIHVSIYTTPAELEAKLAKLKAEVPQFETIYSEPGDDGIDTVVTFRCKGTEECHNLSVPARWLLIRANLVKRGRIAPLGLAEFERGNATGKSGYTNTVLAG